VSPGTVHLRVSHPEYATAEVDAVVAGTGRADRAFDLPPIDLEEPGSVSGHVVDESDRPVSGARVGVGVVGAYLSASSLASGTVMTKADGVFLLDRVRPGKVDVEAVLAGAGRGRATGVVVDSGRTSEDVVIRLSPSEDAESAATGGVAVTLAETRKIGQEPKIVVVHVAEGSEAEHAGIVAGDVLTAVDRAAPTSLADARKRLSGPDGSDVVIDVTRSDEKNSLRVRRERIRR
jgi:S1-C subfamily serine protease